MRPLARLAYNAGSALAVGGTVLAVGFGLGAIGLSEVASRRSPFCNVWVVTGLVVALIALTWTLVTFAARLWADFKIERFRSELSRAMNAGRALLAGARRDNLDAFRPAATGWTEQVADLIEAGLGAPEREWFLSSPRLVGQWVVGAPEVRDLSDRLNRLADVLAKPVVVDLRFDHRRDWVSQHTSGEHDPD